MRAPGLFSFEFLRLLSRPALLLLWALAGCWAPALQLAPVAVQATEAVGVGAGSLVASHSARSKVDRGDDEIDRHERCENLRETPPAIVELRTTIDAPPSWRALTLEHSSGAPAWALATGSDGSAEMSPTQQLDALGFAPPLKLTPKSVAYLAYAPAEPQSGAEADQLDNFQAEFGGGAGTFNANQRVYQYALVNKLPCFPLWTAMQ